MAENYKLPGSSYEEFVKIIKAYSTGKVGVPMSLEVIAQSTGMDKTIVSRNNGFLVQLSLVSDGNKKSPTQQGLDLGRAYTLKIDEQIIRIWRNIIDADEFLSRMLSAIRIRNGMEKASFVNHILYSSGSSNNNNTRAGANTIIEIYKTAGLVSESDGKISALEVTTDNTVAQPTEEIISNIDNIPVANMTPILPMNNLDSRIAINININIDTSELDTLPEKLKVLLDSLKR